MSINPTPEQQEAMDLFAKGDRGDTLAIEAGAGTGKTATLKAIAESTEKRIQYLAFNRSIVDEAKRTMPRNVAASTAHSLAFKGVGKRYAHRLNSSRMRSDDVARILRIDPITIRYGDTAKELRRGFLAGHVMRALTRFCQSADPEPAAQHFPYIDGIDEPVNGKRSWGNNEAIRRALLPALRKAWTDVQDEHGQLRFAHDHYLKMWQLQGGQIGCDALLVDEAQDLSPVMLAIVEQQKGTQAVLVGDSAQQIYEWRGAVNALDRVPANDRTFLTQSFRFGEAIADVANKALERAGAQLRLAGLPTIPSRLDTLEEPRAILARSNAGTMGAFMAALEDGGQPHLVGGGKEIVSFARGARDLQQGCSTSHPELACFSSWGEVQSYVAQDPQGDELKLMVKLIDDNGADRIIRALDNMPSEERASVVISTVHKAKGREWETVQLAPDFGAEDVEGPEEWRLLYVAATRAQKVLDLTACAPLVKAISPDEADEADQAAAAAEVETTEPVETTESVKFSCPECGFEFTRPQARCQSESACRRRQAKRAEQ